MKNLQIFYSVNTTATKLSATSCLAKCLNENKTKEVLLLLSGGSAFSLLDSDNKWLRSQITIGVLDERYSSDPKINNFQQLSSTSFFSWAKMRGCKFINTTVKRNESIVELAHRFEKELKNWKDRNPKGLIIITQGMGPDGHTSGIMPYPENKDLFVKQFEDESKWVVSYDARKKNSYSLRVTTTIPFLKLVDISVMYAVGKEKANVLKKILSEKIPRNIFPITTINEMKQVFLFTDNIIN